MKESELAAEAPLEGERSWIVRRRVRGNLDFAVQMAGLLMLIGGIALLVQASENTPAFWIVGIAFMLLSPGLLYVGSRPPERPCCGMCGTELNFDELKICPGCRLPLR